MPSFKKRVGLVSNLSGIFGKQGCAVLSNVAGDGGFRYEDVTEAAAALDRPVPLDPGYVGPATIVAYTVVFHERRHGACACGL